ncbi:hypothetical protein B566_EDAN003938 [Ephemera danica]|nr:hypothetical protein B566_EDAN003938 [Ephemera danica]
MAIHKIAAVLAALLLTAAAAPGGADEKDTQPYEFEYGVSTAADPHHGGSGQQGHAEARVGDHSIGNYFVRLPEQGASSKVKYTTDLWGFHPDVEYETPNSKTKFAFGDRAVAQVTRADFPGNLPVSIDAAAKVASFDVDDTLTHLAAAGSPPIPE